MTPPAPATVPVSPPGELLLAAPRAIFVPPAVAVITARLRTHAATMSRSVDALSAVNLVMRPGIAPTSPRAPTVAAPGPRAATTAIVAALLPALVAVLLPATGAAGPRLVADAVVVCRLLTTAAAGTPATVARVASPATAHLVITGAYAVYNRSATSAGAITTRVTAAATAAVIAAGTVATIPPAACTAPRPNPWCSPRGILLLSPARTCTWLLSALLLTP